MTAAFLEVLTAEIRSVTVFHNGGPLAAEGRAVLAEYPVRVRDAGGWPFYRMWNEGILAGRPVSLVLNNDITWHPGELARLALTLQTQPQDVAATYVKGRWTDRRGLAGWCFAIRWRAFRKAGRIDERYATWYGDHELVLRLRRAGFRTLGIPAQVSHQPSTTMAHRPDIEAERMRDAALFEQRWP